MAMKPGSWALALLLLSGAPPARSQESPLRWPVPPPGPPHEPVFPRLLIGPGELAGRLKAGTALPLDARGAGLFERGHLPGAVLAWSPEEEAPWKLERVRSLMNERGITGGKTVVIYGDRERAAHLFWLLRWAGCPVVQILDGGLDAWRAAGGTLKTTPSRPSPSELRSPSSGSVVVDPEWVAGAFGQAGVELLDVRDARGWDTWQTPPVFGAGHIPYSLPFDPGALLPPNGGWPDAVELRRRLGMLGPRAGDPVKPESTFVLYGESPRDPRLGLGYFLLSLAGLEARVFPGGWQEWMAAGDHPVVRVISATELASLLERENPGLDQDRRPRGLILLDLREHRDFAIGHLPGALFVPYDSTAEVLAEILEMRIEKEWPRADRTLPLVLYCYGPDCIRSREAGAHAARLGFRNVLWFRGGIREWRDTGYPLIDSAVPTARRVSPGGGAARP
jgi:thiosulfate/3-mercaptopyruvate sulfurtransferase